MLRRICLFPLLPPHRTLRSSLPSYQRRSYATTAEVCDARARCDIRNLIIHLASFRRTRWLAGSVYNDVRVIIITGDFTNSFTTRSVSSFLRFAGSNAHYNGCNGPCKCESLNDNDSGVYRVMEKPLASRASSVVRLRVDCTLRRP